MANDEFTWTDASTYGLDGFSFSGVQNEGVLQSARLPQTKGMSALPGDLIESRPTRMASVDLHDEDAGINLGSLLGTSKVASLVDLSWLDPNQTPDPTRVPRDRKPHDYANPRKRDYMGNSVDVIPQLQRAWGRHSTDGIAVVANTGPIVSNPSTSVTSKEAVELLRLASRLSHAGVDPAKMEDTVKMTLGKTFDKYAKVWQAIKAEHGLVGNVYVRAESFPGIEKGAWDKQVRSFKGSYLVGSNARTASALGKVAVATVPWKEACERYTQVLEERGLVGGQTKGQLKQAFLQPKPLPAKPTFQKRLYRDYIPARKAETWDLAKEATEEEKLAQARVEAHARIDKLAKSNLITGEQATKLKSVKDHVKALKVASAFAARGKVSKYPAPPKPKVKASKTASAPNPIEEVVKFARDRMNRGEAGRKLVASLKGSFSDEVLRSAEKHLTHTRKAHEGLSGFLYVDPGPYAAEGPVGCDRASRNHFASLLEYVRPVSACTRCPFSTITACAKFDKPFLENVSDFHQTRLAHIRMANANEKSQVAAMFKTVDADPYQLKQDFILDIPEDSGPKPLAEVKI